MGSPKAAVGEHLVDYRECVALLSPITVALLIGGKRGTAEPVGGSSGARKRVNLVAGIRRDVCAGRGRRRRRRAATSLERGVGAA
eukprot:4422488-Prymnesium_polylepis.1